MILRIPPDHVSSVGYQRSTRVSALMSEMERRGEN
jgi:hypothetical protein